jgi:hypothetical protein
MRRALLAAVLASMQLVCAETLCVDVNVTIMPYPWNNLCYWQLDGGATQSGNRQACLAPGPHTFTALNNNNSMWMNEFWTVARGCAVFGGGPSVGTVPFTAGVRVDFDFTMPAPSTCGAGSFGSADGSCSPCPPGTYIDLGNTSSCCACSDTTAALGFGFARSWPAGESGEPGRCFQPWRFPHVAPKESW